MKNNKRFFKLGIVCVFALILMLTLTSCGQNKTLKTYEESANAVLNTQQTTLVVELNKKLSTTMQEDEKVALKDRINYAAAKIDGTKKELNSQVEALLNAVKEEGIDFSAEKNAMLSEFAKIKSDDELKNETSLKNFKEKVRTFVLSTANDSLKNAMLGKIEEEFKLINKEALGSNSNLLDTIYSNIESYVNTYTTVVEKARQTNVDVKELKIIILNTTLDAVKSEMVSFKDNHTDGVDEYRVLLIEQALEKYEEQLENVTELDYTSVEDEKIEETKNGYQILKNFTLDTVEYTSSKRQEPISWKPIEKFGDFFSYFFNNFLVFPIGWLMKTLSVLFGGYYVIGLLLATVLVRTIAWPIYAKTNDMTIKMQLMQPELNKLQEKYANRPDPESQNQMRMEQARLYKKYKVGIGGCLLQFLQFPIFIAVFNAVNRMPYTTGEVPGTNDWLSQLNTRIAGIDLLKDHGELWSNDFWAIILILLLVLLTQQINQKVNEIKQKAAQEKAQENIPAYRRQAASQTANNSSMKYMMAFLSVMMVVFVWQSAAGLGIYWLIGNVYSTVQTVINNKLSEKRAEKLKNKYESFKY